MRVGIAATIRAGSRLAPWAQVGDKAVLGNDVHIEEGAAVGHRAHLRSGVLAGPGAAIGDRCRTGKVVRIGRTLRPDEWAILKDGGDDNLTDANVLVCSPREARRFRNRSPYDAVST